MNRSEFVGVIVPVALKLWQEGNTCIFPSIRLAQTLLETGGRIHEWNNLVGYKVGSGAHTAYWHGRSVSTSTWEVYDNVTYDNVTANWRAYDSIEDCFRDQDLLFNLDRYKGVREATTPEDQAVALYRCGYATDPDYHKKIISIAEPYKTYDTERKPVEKEGAEMEKGVGKTIVNTWMKPSYAKAETQEERDYIHWLANQVRKACGMKEDEEFE